MSTRALVLLDSIALVNATHAGTVIVSGSHGGLSASHFVTAQTHKPFAVAFNDAGGGKDNAGRVALHELQAVGVLAILYAHTSARIGEAQDGLDNGVVNGLNELALAQGLQLGWRIAQVVRHLGADPNPDPDRDRAQA
ncbi:hypothetical protein [Limnohabitans sp.]|uniref:hypothetical protein n=1 Tax=Limnohabitans sp. TaxID=1907725 RepID=UPI0037C07084